jgi:hypothetical protein
MQFCFTPIDPADLAAGYGFAAVLDGQEPPSGAYCISLDAYCTLSYEEMQAKLKEHFGGAAPAPTPEVSPTLVVSPVSTPEDEPEDAAPTPEPPDSIDAPATKPGKGRGR